VEIQQISSVKIEGVYASLPSKVVDNVSSLRQIYSDKAESIVKATGIEKRRIADEGVSPLDLCISAAEALFARLCPSESRAEFLGSFGAVIFVSFTEKIKMPAASCRAQSRLSLPSDVLTLDMSLACSGWCSALSVASRIASATGKRVLLLDGDVQSNRIKDGDKATTPVLADGGTATVVAPQFSDASQPFEFSFLSVGEKGSALSLSEGGYIEMDGFGVYKFVATDVVSFLRKFISCVRPFDAFVPHQANVYMIRQLAKTLGVEEKLKISADLIGNISSASIPATIALLSPQERENDITVLSSGFGGGLSASAALFVLDRNAVTGVCEYGCRE
jgi:3-oxoacyl-[acyl-carrier-protein] synthase-3